MSGSIVLALRLISTLALFGFLGWTLYYLYREVNRHGNSLANRRVPGISVTVRAGAGKHSVKHFSQSEILLGRDPGCDIPILDETVSTRHAQLSYHHKQWWLEDLSSTNGTLLNGTDVSMPTVITSGDEIRCGATKISITLSENVLIEPTVRLTKDEA